MKVCIILILSSIVLELSGQVNQTKKFDWSELLHGTRVTTVDSIITLKSGFKVVYQHDSILDHERAGYVTKDIYGLNQESLHAETIFENKRGRSMSFSGANRVIADLDSGLILKNMIVLKQQCWTSTYAICIDTVFRLVYMNKNTFALQNLGVAPFHYDSTFQFIVASQTIEQPSIIFRAFKINELGISQTLESSVDSFKDDSNHLTLRSPLEKLMSNLYREVWEWKPVWNWEVSTPDSNGFSVKYGDVFLRRKEDVVRINWK